MKRFFFLLCLFSGVAFAQVPAGCQLSRSMVQNSSEINPKNINHNGRSDTTNILHYHVALDMTDFAGQTIAGSCRVDFAALINGMNEVHFDLLQLTVDSIVMNGFSLTYQYNDTLLKVMLNQPMNTGDSSQMTIYYHGHPQGDPSGWGGFYFQSGYAYNLGVGFEADPHTYGRVWHPCFDNFVERATYEFLITTQTTHRAICNGLFMGMTTNGSGLPVWNWKLDEEIPSYLSCVAVSGYQVVNQTFSGLNGSVPVNLAALAVDTTNMKLSFTHLEDCFDIFESRFGPYKWSRVGYVLVPFNSGAMEHATSIAYPRVATVGGSLAYEASLMAHELSHHWFGDLVTCQTAEDMWLNEGMASYSSFIFTEGLYGRKAYQNAVRTNHASLLQFAHHKEGGYRAISGVPHSLTYGDHVYNKGADMAHTIRAYLGDSLFFGGLTNYIDQNSYQDVTSALLRDNLSAFSGINLQDCFDNLVFNGGWTHFSLDSFQVSGTVPNINVTLYIKQKLTGAPAMFTGVPLEVNFMDSQWNNVIRSVVASGSQTSVTVSVPFIPSYISLNHDEKISDANVSEERIIRATGNQNYTDGKFNLTVSQLTDSAVLRVQHAFSSPDTQMVNGPYRLSPNHYWHLEGLHLNNISGYADVKYDGRTSSYSANYYMDNLLFTTGYNEDSLVLLHRGSASEAWSLFPYYSKIAGPNVNDKNGTMRIDSILAGDYVFAMGPGPLALKTGTPPDYPFTVFPNPAGHTISVVIPLHLRYNNITFTINDINGRKTGSFHNQPGDTSCSYDVDFLPAGTYSLDCQVKGSSYRTSFIVKK